MISCLDLKKIKSKLELFLWCIHDLKKYQTYERVSIWPAGVDSILVRVDSSPCWVDSKLIWADSISWWAGSTYCWADSVLQAAEFWIPARHRKSTRSRSSWLTVMSRLKSKVSRLKSKVSRLIWEDFVWDTKLNSFGFKNILTSELDP